MFRKSLKSLVLSLLCLLTLSCTFLVEEETGSISFTLPESRSVMHTRGNETTDEVKYHVTITPENSSYTDFRYDKDNLSGVVHIDRVPLGNYFINVTAKSDKYNFFMKEHKPLSFRIYPGRPTNLQIELDCERIPLPEPQPLKGCIKGAIINGPVQDSGIELRFLVKDGNDNIIDAKIENDNSLYVIRDLDYGMYSISISGGNDKVSYSGYKNVEVNKEEILNQDITLHVTNEFGSITGSVLMPTQRNNLNLTVTAINEVTKDTNIEKVDNSTGNFTIDYLKEGNYTISVSGTSDEGSYVQSNIETIKVIKNTSSEIKNKIDLVETLNKRRIHITSKNTITDDALFTIELKKDSSINEYKKDNQSLPFTTDYFEPGEYKLIITGKGKHNNYKAEDIITVPMGLANKDVEHIVHLNVVQMVGSVNGKITGDVTFDAIQLNVIATDKNGSAVTGDVVNNSSYSFINLPIGEYKISVSSTSKDELLDVLYTGEVQVVVEEGKTTTKDIVVKSNNELGNIAGTVTLPSNKSELKLTAKAIISGSSEVENISSVDLSTGYFDISALPEGTYTVKILGSNSTATFEGSSSKVTVTRNKRSTIAENINLVETLNKGTVTLNTTSPINDDAIFTIKIQDSKNLVKTFSNQALPYTMDNYEPGNYLVYIAGKGRKNNYVSNPEWQSVNINPNDNKTISISLLDSLITGSVSGKIVGTSVKTGTVVAHGINSTSKTGTVNNGNYEIRDLPIGQYTIKVNGENDIVYYEGELLNLVIKEGENTGNNINVTEYSQYGSISGKVALPKNNENLNLTVKPYSITSNKEVGEGASVNILDGSFTISNLAKDSYTLKVTGSSNTSSYEGSYNSPINVERNQTSKISTSITLKETINKRNVILNSWINTSEDNASFTIDLKKENTNDSLSGYPVTIPTSLPYKLGQLEPGNYKVIVNGEGNSNRYNTEEIITVPMGPLNKDVEIKVSLNVVQMKGNVEGKITLEPDFNGITVEVIATDKSGFVVTGNVVNNSSYSFNNLPVGEYTISASGKFTNETFDVSYTGEAKKVVVVEKGPTVQDIVLKSNNTLGNIAGTVTLPSNKDGVNLIAKAVFKETSEVKNSASVDPITGYFDISALPEGIYTLKIEGKDNTKTYEGMIDNVQVTKNKRNTISEKIALNEMCSSLKISFSNMPTLAVNMTVKLTKGTTEVGTYTSKSDQTLSIPDLKEGSDYSIEITGENSGRTYSYSQKNIVIESGKETSITAAMVGTAKKGNLLVSFQNAPINPIKLTVKVINKKGKVVQEKSVNSNETLTIKNLAVAEFKIEVTGQNDTDTYTFTEPTFKIEANKDNSLSAALVKTARKGSLKINLSNAPSSNTSLTIKLTKGAESVYNQTVKVSEIATIQNLLVGNDYSLEISGEDSNNSYSFTKSNILIEADKENTVSVSLTVVPKENGKIQVRFTQGPSPAIDVTVTLYRGTSKIESKVGKSSDHIFFTNLAYGNNYKIEAKGNTSSGKKYEFVKENININSTTEVIVDAPLKEIASEIKPDPSKGIFVVDASGNDNSDGTKPFKTITGARKKAVNAFNKTTFTVYVTSDIAEPTTVDGGNGYAIAENVTITSPNNKKVTITTSLPFLMSYNNPSITLGEGITINNISKDKQVVKLGEKCKLYLQSSSNLAPDNYVNIQMGGILSLNKGYNGEDGAVNIKMIGQNGVDSEVGGATGNLILETVDASTLPLVDAVRKVNLISSKYVLNSDGRLADKPKVQTINNINELRTACTNGGEYYLNSTTPLEVTSALTITKPLTLRTNVPTTIQRSGNYIGNLIKVSPKVSLSLIGTKGKEIIIDGGATNSMTADCSLISSQGHLDMDYCVLQNNNNTKKGSKEESLASALYFGPYSNNTQATTPVQNLTMKNCTIKNNTVANGEAAIVLKDNVHQNVSQYESNVTISNCTITGNTSKKGTLLAEGARVIVNINNTNINSNTVSGNGGGLNISNANITLTDSIIENNRSGSLGHGVYLNKGNLLLQGTSVIRGNGNNIGALSVQSDKGSTANTTLNNNVAPGSGNYDFEITKDTTTNIK